MEEAVSAAEANRKFSQILRGVKEGRTYVVTAHGTPVARIAPASRAECVERAARQALLTRLRAQPVQVIGARWSRESLYED